MNMKKMKIGESVKTNNVLINTTSRAINVLDSAVIMLITNNNVLTVAHHNIMN